MAGPAGRSTVNAVTDPAYRGTLVRTIIEMIDAQPPLRELIDSSVSRPDLQRMRSATRLAWLPAGPFDRLKETHFEHVGADAYEAFWRAHMTGVADIPLFRSLLESGRRIFGASPAGLIKWMPKGWALSTRGCGTFTVEFAADRGSASVVLADAHPSSRQTSTGHAAKATLQGMCEILSMEGTVELDDGRAKDGHFEMGVRWT